jgi:hypothetical protein
MVLNRGWSQKIYHYQITGCMCSEARSEWDKRWFMALGILICHRVWRFINTPVLHIHSMILKLWVNCYSNAKIWGAICFSRYNSCIPTRNSSLTILVLRVTNSGNVSTNTFLPGNTRDRGVKEFFLTIVGRWSGMFQMPSTERNQ